METLNLEPSILNEFYELLHDKPYFAQHDFDLGKYDDVNHFIPTIHNHKPKKRNYHRLSPARHAFLKEMVLCMLHYGIIRPSTSPWAAPVVLPLKGDSFRLCHGYEAINDVTIPWSYPITKIDDALFTDFLIKARFFSKIDTKNAYWNVMMNPPDIYKTAFITPFGLFEYLRLPQGLRNAVATYQSIVTSLFFHEIGVFVIVYLDDLLVFSETAE